MKMLFLLVALSTMVIADDQARVRAGFDSATDMIADNYEAGAYLIYDCTEKHWTCVGEEFNQQCIDQREKDRLFNLARARCAPLERFPTKKACFQRQLFLTTHNFGDKVCVLPNWREKEITF